MVALHRDASSLVEVERNHSVDLQAYQDLQVILSQEQPDVVVHCAGLVDVEACERSPEMAFAANVQATEHIVRAIGSHARFVYISSDAVYGNTNDHSEAAVDLVQTNEYARTKYLGEGIVQEHCNDYLIVRTNLFGWNANAQRQSSAEWMYDTLRHERRLKLFTDYRFSPILTEFIGHIIIELLVKNEVGVFNVGAPQACSKYEFGCVLARIFGFDETFIEPTRLADHEFVAQRPRDLSLDVTRLVRTGIEVPDYEVSVARFHEQWETGMVSAIRARSHNLAS